MWKIFIMTSFNFRRHTCGNFFKLTMRSGSRIPHFTWILSYHWCNLRLHACLFIYFWINQTALHEFFIICTSYVRVVVYSRKLLPQRPVSVRIDATLEFNRKCQRNCAQRWSDEIASHRTIKTNFAKHSFIIIIHRQSSPLIQLRLLEPFSCRIFFFVFSISFNVHSLPFSHHELALGIHFEKRNRCETVISSEISIVFTSKEIWDSKLQ